MERARAATRTTAMPTATTAAMTTATATAAAAAAAAGIAATTSATTRATLSGSRWAQRRDPEERHRKILPPPEGVSTEIQKSDTVKF